MRNIYRYLAFTLFNTLLLLLAVNLLLAGYFLVKKDPPPVHPEAASHRDRFNDPAAYTRISPEVAARYLREEDAMGGAGLRYAPWVQFRNPRFHGELLNTDERGFRRTSGPRRPAPNARKVFLFGGSTTFGYGVPDGHTIPSYLQVLAEQRAPVAVRNFGQAFYYSSQELTLFLTLLKEGQVPDWAIFIDGLNDTFFLNHEKDEPRFTGVLQEIWDARSGHIPRKPLPDLSWIPMVKLAARVNPVPPPPPPGMRDDGRALTPQDSERIADFVVSRYTANMNILEGVCKQYGVECRFLWQPSPFYKYDRKLHKAFPYAGEVPGYWTAIYTKLRDYRNPNYLYLGDLLENTTAKVFVDDVHYNETTNEAIAGRIRDLIFAESAATPPSAAR